MKKALLIKFKQIPGWEGYFISKYGEVYSNKYSGFVGQLIRRKTRFSKDGRVRVGLSKGRGKQKTFDLGHLVAITWVPNPNNYPTSINIILKQKENPKT